MAAYIPGTCNIGKAQLRRRKFVALAALLSAAAFIALMEVLHFSRPWKFLSVISFSISILCLLQVSMRFCVLFGLKGIFNIDAKFSTSVSDKKHRQADRNKALLLICCALLIGSALTALYIYLSD